MRSDNRKDYPLVRGVLDYFPDALLEVANVSKVGNDQHNPGEPIHWAKEKSTDEADALMRHLIDRGKYDTDNVRHSAKVAWRALALLQREIDAEKGFGASGVVVRSAMTGEETPLRYGTESPEWGPAEGVAQEEYDTAVEMTEAPMDEFRIPEVLPSRPKGSPPGRRSNPDFK